MSLENASEIVAIVVSLMGSIGVSAPIFMRMRQKLTQVRLLLDEIDNSLKDGKLTAEEVKAIVRIGKGLLRK